MARTIFHDEQRWTNWHLSVRDVPIAGRFEILNGSGAASLAGMKETAAEIQKLIGRAIAERRRLRAQGAAWSFSEAPAVPGGWCLATGYANWIFPLPETHVVAEFAGDRTGFFLAQMGVAVGAFNRFVEARGRSLRTSGASNGQTFAGAMSTGTHGSAVDLPAIQSQIVGFQLIPSPDLNLWIEPASRPVTDGRMADAMGATVVRDDRLFAAALVGLGAFGVVHSVLIETRPIFLLESWRQRIPFSDGVRRAMTGGGFDSVDLPGPDVAGGRPYFFQSVVNSHIDKGFAYVTAGYERPWDPGHALSYDLTNKRAPGYNLGVVVANILDAAPGLTPPITKLVLQDQLKPMLGKTGSWGQSFNFTTPRAGTAGASIAVPVERSLEALDIAQRALARTGKAPLAFACRYGVKSPGLLAFVRHPRTCILDLDGLNSDRARAAMRAVLLDIRAAGIPNAEHWGKMNELTAASVRDSYGADLESWIAARTELLGRETEYVFGSAFLDRLGMTNPNW
ncbi:FAD-binding oxidoreductase [Sandaracinobacteroides hominis]|uniref:FAD-binding protein n=1 Tax=Sandaracinobacteroides hominis TaxID=2780086 RepID=UPI0018F6221F|nr:FAD-binding protein [Sandaracinobacteroides hominis]